MKLKEFASLLLTSRLVGDEEVEITGIQMDSRKVTPGDLFVCIPGIPGFLEDRHEYARQAVESGAAALVVERDVDAAAPKLFVNDTRYALAVMSAHFYQYPGCDLKIIGVTGTNGKTTTSFLIDAILSEAGRRTGLMGNTGTKIDQQWLPTDINTQEPPVLHRNFRKMRDQGVEYCTMEVSSQGLDMGRVLGVPFRTAVFTNLTQDHLDYHQTMEQYREAKGLLFSRLGNTFHERKYAVLNADDPASTYFRRVTPAEVLTYGIREKADVTAKAITLTPGGTEFELEALGQKERIRLNLIGRFNVYNTLAAVTTALAEGISIRQIQSALMKVNSVAGRMEVIHEGQDFLVLVDYAHTPDGLENALSTIREFAKGKVITVFGCGGDRDRAKRPVMGRIAARFSDYCIATSDNPRSEDPEQILRDIEQGFAWEGIQRAAYELMADRKTAIQKAIQKASAGDVVLIAGKGHETYQILKGGKIHFDDRETAREVLRSGR